MDQIFIVNHYTTTQMVLSAVEAKGSNILILSSNALFEREKRELKNALPGKEVIFMRFDHWNDELEDADLDRIAYKRSRRWLKYTSIYLRNYQEAIVYVKNEFVYQRMIRDNYLDQNTRVVAFCQSHDVRNLGISYAFWKGKGAMIINSGCSSKAHLMLKKLTKPMWVRLPIYLVRAFCLAIKPQKVDEILIGEEKFYLLTHRRIKVKPTLDQKPRWVIPMFCRSGSLTVPVHSSGHLTTMYPFVKRSNMVIVEDAFRPTTYPPFYYGKPFLGCRFVPRDRVDATFFKTAGVDILPVGTLLEEQRLTEEEKEVVSTVNQICLSLNHAGNWTTLIDRSDTDGLIVEYVKLARNNPSLNFIVRLHPTSDAPKGEGVGWMNRIRKEVQATKIPNLEVSSVSLEEDWERADVFISEYSLSVVDALKYGKFAIFLNLTRRRSFVQDLVDVGFVEVSSMEQLQSEIDSIRQDPSVAYQRLLGATRKYNQTYIDLAKGD